MLYAFFADLLVLFHFFYVTFAVGGEFFILAGAFLKLGVVRNFAFRIAHLIAVVFVALESLVDLLCPLTEWEYNLRELAGQRVEREISFLGRLLRRIIFYDFPSWAFTFMYVGFGALVILTFILIPPRRKR
ncbi:MAG: DUF2784 family protein [Spirochaeta sp.]|nr:DUF2784 family protein [Spirochaeta sp.]